MPGGFHTRDTTAAGRRKRNWSSRCAVETLDEALGEYNPVEGGLITPKQARRRGAQAPFCAGSSPPSCSVLRLSFVETGQEHSGASEERFHANGASLWGSDREIRTPDPFRPQIRRAKVLTFLRAPMAVVLLRPWCVMMIPTCRLPHLAQRLSAQGLRVRRGPAQGVPGASVG